MDKDSPHMPHRGMLGKNCPKHYFFKWKFNIFGALQCYIFCVSWNICLECQKTVNLSYLERNTVFVFLSKSVFGQNSPKRNINLHYCNICIMYSFSVWNIFRFRLPGLLSRGHFIHSDGKCLGAVPSLSLFLLSREFSKIRGTLDSSRKNLRIIE